MIVLDLPLPPPLSSLTTNASKGKKGRVSTDRYKTWKRAAGNEILRHKRKVGVQCIPGRIKLTIMLSFHDLFTEKGELSKVRQDMDNRVKAIADILGPKGHNFIADDSIIDDLHVYRSWDIERGRVRVFVNPCNLFEKKDSAA